MQLLVEVQRRIAAVRCENLSVLDEFTRHCFVVENILAEHRTQVRVLLLDVFFESRSEVGLIAQIDHSQTDASRFVLVRRTDAAPCGPDLAFPTLALARLIDRFVIRQNQMGFLADPQPARLGQVTALSQLFDFTDQRPRIDDDTATDHARGIAVQRSGWDEMQNGLLIPDHQSMTRVVAALKTDNNIRLGRKQIDDLALPLVSPLESDDDGAAYVSRSAHAQLR